MHRLTSPSSPSGTVYHYKYRWLYLLIGLLFIGDAGYYGIRQGALLAPLLSLLGALFMVLLAQVPRIVISPTGITYHTIGFYTIEAPWHNVERIIVVATVFGTIRCLTLRLPVVRGWTGFAPRVRPAERGRTIPLSDGWARSEQLERQIRQYAPHICN